MAAKKKRKRAGVEAPPAEDKAAERSERTRFREEMRAQREADRKLEAQELAERLDRGAVLTYHTPEEATTQVKKRTPPEALKLGKVRTDGNGNKLSDARTGELLRDPL